MTSRIDRAKQAVGRAAAALIQDGMIVGLGTGSTAAYFIESLIERCHHGLKIRTVATSERSEKQAREGGIPFLDVNALTSIDIVVDGADEIDSRHRMIKGGGGALLREKIVASMAKEMVVVVDEQKVVSQLGKFPLPLEIIPFAYLATQKHIQHYGYSGIFRKQPNGDLYLTDNGNYIFDVSFSKTLSHPEKEDAILRSIPGVVETGFFFNLARRVLIGCVDGSVRVC